VGGGGASAAWLGSAGSRSLSAPARPLRLPFERLHAGDAAGEGLGRGGRAPPQERLVAGTSLSRLGRARRSVRRLARPALQRARPRERPLPVSERLAEERSALRPLPPSRFEWSGYRSVRVPLDGYLKHAQSFYRAPERLVQQGVELRFDRDQVWICHRGAEVARYRRSYEQGIWLPPPIMRLDAGHLEGVWGASSRGEKSALATGAACSSGASTRRRSKDCFGYERRASRAAASATSVAVWPAV
jgi:hypothetical protein